MNQQLLFVIITIMNVIIISLLLIIRNYQKQISKIKQEQILIKNCINQTVNNNDLNELQNKYDILMKILNNIQEGKNDKSEKEEIS